MNKGPEGQDFEKNIGQRSRVCFPLRLNCGEKKKLDYKMQRSHFSDSESTVYMIYPAKLVLTKTNIVL